MLHELEQLEQLMLGGDFDEESKKAVRKLRSQFQQAVAKEELTKHPSIVPYIQYLKDEVARCKELLSESEGLTELERIKLFERKRACRDFLSNFGDTSQLEQTIKQLLHVAKNS